MNRTLVAWLLALGLLFSRVSSAFAQEAPARTSEEQADTVKLECARAYESSQRARQRGELTSAREQALLCAQARCPGVLSGECAEWLGQLEQDLPSVIVELRDGAGEAVGAARLSIDDEEVAKSLDGRAFTLDPGPHRVRITLPDSKVLEKSVVLSQGRKGELVRFQLPREPSRPTPVPLRSARSPAFRSAALVVALAGATGFGYFAWQGRHDENELESCAPRCSTASVDGVRRTYVAADVSLGVGVLALGAFGYLWATRGEEKPQPVMLIVTPSVAALSVRHSF